MSKLFRNRWLRWAFVLGVLIALGCGIYHVEEPEPMCVIESENASHSPHLSPDGSRLVTFSAREAEMKMAQQLTSVTKVSTNITIGPLIVWDTRTGAEKMRRFEDQQELRPISVSKDRRFLAAGVSVLDGKPRSEKDRLSFIALLNLETGELRKMHVQDRTRSLRDQLWFSDSGELLVSSNNRESVRVYETTTGRVVFEHKAHKLVDVAGELLSILSETGEDKFNLQTWNPRENRMVAELADVAVDYIHSQCDRYLLIRRSTQDDQKPAVWAIWNRRALKLEGEIAADNDLMDGMNPAQPLVVERTVGKTKHLAFCDLPSGRILAEVPWRTSYWNCPDGRFMALSLKDVKPLSIEMREVPSMRTLWKRELNDAKPLEFCPDSKTFFLLQQSPRELHALDCQTGELRGTIRLPMCEKGLTRLHLAADKKSVIIKDGPAKTAKSSMWIWLENWFPVLKDHQGQGTYTVVILDPETCRERIRLTIARSDGVYGDLSEDGRTLLTIHPNFDSGDRRELRCWDVNAWKPLHWPIGIPAALAGVLVLFAWWRGRRRKPPVAPSESQ